MQPFELLGELYLGRRYADAAVTEENILYDAHDLTTHAVCVGMTGSGKTGLCISLLEEALLDGIPAIAIDPKGDISNLMLRFPQLRPEDFRPWIDEGQARREKTNPDDLARQTAELWKSGLAKWGQDGERIQRLSDAADFRLYTPGSNAGIPINVLQSFAAPDPAAMEDEEILRERILGTASSVLTLLDIDPDPVQSREHILLSNILDRNWRAGRDLDLPTLIQEIQQPPFERIGVMDVETFYPAKDRLGFAMALNNLLASPSFAAWLEGEPLDIRRLFWTDEGKPRMSIISIAHLNDSERMFFVTLLLSELLAWVRGQEGTSSLRALLYMDEIFGFFPPVAKPPSKPPMLALLKQARAFGLGIVLATQNPVDLDYKGLANTGTWFIGRLQTERDQARMLDGLAGANIAMDRSALEATLAGLSKRVFLMHNVHEDAPVLFHTRWAMSYLRGPLTRVEIKRLDQSAPAAAPAPPPVAGPAPGAAAPSTGRPPLASAIPQLILERKATRGAGAPLRYDPALLGRVRVHFVENKYQVDLWKELVLLVPGASITSGGDPWGLPGTAQRTGLTFAADSEQGATFAEVPQALAFAEHYDSWNKALVNHCYNQVPLLLWRCKDLKAISKPDELEGEFRARLTHYAREQRDQELENLRTKYGPKLERLRDRIRSAESALEREESQYKEKSLDVAINIGTTLVDAFFGRKLSSATNVRRMGSGLKGAGRAGAEKEDIARAKEKVTDLQLELNQLEGEFQDETLRLQTLIDPSTFILDQLPIRPKKAEILVEEVALAWVPVVG